MLLRKKELHPAASMKLVGQGTFGRVYATRSAAGGPVVVKKMQLSKRTVHAFHDEMACQSVLRLRGGHPNVLPFAKYFTDEAGAAVVFVMEAGVGLNFFAEGNVICCASWASFADGC